MTILYVSEVSKNNNNKTSHSSSSSSSSHFSPSFILLQINDVYELKPISGRGGLAHVAGIKKQLSKEAPVRCVLAGDYISPSALSTAKDQKGETLAGRQMIDVANLFVDYATLGNHEFDVSANVLSDRLKESTNFTWVAGNVNFSADVVARSVVVPHKVEAIGGVSVLFVGVAPDYETPSYVTVANITTSISDLKQNVAKLRLEHRPDVVIAITHLSIDEDRQLALTSNIGVDFIIGGHEHENSLHRVTTSNFIPIAKADANAQSVFVHRFYVVGDKNDLNSDDDDLLNLATMRIKLKNRSNNNNNKYLIARSELRRVDDDHDDDNSNDKLVAARINYWWDIAKSDFKRRLGIDIDGSAGYLTSSNAMDFRDEVMRYQTAAGTGQWLADALLSDVFCNNSASANFALYNSGMVRLNARLGPGNVSTYDTLRVLPFSNKIITVQSSGEVVKKLLTVSRSKNVGSGGFLQTSTNFDLGSIKATENYKYKIPDYLGKGLEKNLGFFKVEGVAESGGGDMKITKISDNEPQAQQCMMNAMKKQFSSR
eukprot:PhM_4_TR11575/c0_g1_i1/m.29199